MSYFNLRKRSPEADAEPDEADVEEPEETPEETAEEPEEKQPATEHGPLLTGILGPGRWLAAHFGPGAALGVHAVAVWAVFFYGGWPAAGILTLWLVAVLAFVPREYLERLAARLEPSTGHDQKAEEETPTEPLAAVLWQLIGDAPGTHLKTLTTHLQQATPEQPLDRAAVRAKLGALGITVKPSVRDAAGKVNEGVHRADLKAWEETLSPTGTGTPPEPRSSPVATPVTSNVGTDATAVATPRPRLRRLLPRGGP
jgi:hypothetical protein